MLRDKKIFLDLANNVINFYSYIKNTHKFYFFSIASATLFTLLTILAIFPITINTKTTEAATTPATATLNITSTSGAANIEMRLKHKSDAFAASSKNITFNVTTNNLTGYTLAIKGSEPTGKLVNTLYGDTIDSITSATNATDFANDPSTTYTNKWGLRPSKFNSLPNTNYLPAPTTSFVTLDTTSAANTVANKYTIDIAARLDSAKSTGDYTNTITLTAITNPISYEFNFSDSTSDSSVTNLPAMESGTSVSISSFTFPNTVPTRTGYTFKSWCDGTVAHVAGGDSTCSGATYAKGAIYTNFNNPANPTNKINFYAMWSSNNYSITLNNSDATTQGSTKARVLYDNDVIYAGDSGTTDIVNPIRSYNVSGFTTTTNNSTGSTVSDTTTRTFSYNFDGWYTDDSTPTKIISASKTLVPNTPYTNSNGKWIATSNVNLRAHWNDSGKITLPTIKKTGHNCGWTTKTSGATTIEYDSGYDSLKPTANMTLCGVCIAKKHNITIKTSPGISKVSLGGRECTEASGCTIENLTYGQTYDLIATIDAGYTFGSWSGGAPGAIANTIAATTKYTVGDGDSTITPYAGANKYDVVIKTVTGVSKVILDNHECTLTSGCAISGLVYGQTYDLVAEVAPGYTFKSWSGGSPGTINNTTTSTTTYTVGSEGSTITPSVTINTYDVTIKTVTGISKVTLNGTPCTSTSGCTVPNLVYGQQYDLVATPATGYDFGSWNPGSYGSIASNTATTKYTVGTGDSTITPSATAKKYSITIKTVTGISKVTLNGTECTLTSGCTVPNLVYGQQYDLIATPATGYDFSSWSGGSPGTIADATTTTTKYTVGDGDSTITPSATAKKYNITIKIATGISSVSLNGTPCTSTSGCTVPNLVYGQQYDLVATPATGYDFTSWGAGSYGSIANTTAATTKYTVGAGNSTITPSATAKKYNITIKPTTGVYSVTLNNGSPCYNTSGCTVSNLTYNQSYSLTTTMNTGYSFSGWSGGSPGTIADTTAATTTYTVKAGDATITSSAKISEYTLTVKPNGGTWNGSTSNQTIKRNYGESYTLADPTAVPSYSISYNANSQGITPPASTTVNRPFSSWSKTSGAGGLSGKVYTFGNGDGEVTANYSNPSFTLPAISKTGYTCKWARNSASGDQVAGGSSTTITGNTTFYAVCSVKQYNVSLNGNGASNSYTTSTKATYGSTTLASIATLPTKSNGSATRTVSFGRGTNASGANIAGSTTANPASKNSTATITYTFNGWHQSSGTGTLVASNATSPALQASISGITNSSKQWIYDTTANPAITLYAGWNSSTGSYSKVTLPTITKGGYDCGWSTSSTATSATYASGYTDYVPTSNITLYGICKAHVYTVTLNKNGASNTPTASTTVTYGATSLASIATLPTKSSTTATSTVSFAKGETASGATISSTASKNSTATVTYAFNGWHQGSGTGALVASNSTSPALQASVSGLTNASRQWIATSNQTLYAGWNSSTGSFSAIALPKIEKTGYKCGWATSSSASSITYKSEGSYTPSGNITLYGTCIAKTYDVTLWSAPGFSKVTLNDCTITNIDDECITELTYDKTYTLTATMASGFTFGKWTLAKGSGTFTSASSTSAKFTVKGTGTIKPTVNLPYIQDYTVSTCKSEASSKNVKVVDARDGQVYTVHYIKDRCWMTRNLAIGCDGVADSYGSSRRTNVELNSDNTNTTKSSYKTTTSNLASLSGGDDYSVSRMMCNSTNGAWYNYKAATIATITGDSNSTTAEESLCPKGWKMPTLSQANTLIDSSTVRETFNATAGGRWYNGEKHESEKGLWWTRTADSDTKRDTLFYNYENSSRMEIQTQGRERGLYIRCVRA